MEGKGREGKGREAKGREAKGREAKGSEGKGSEGNCEPEIVRSSGTFLDSIYISACENQEAKGPFENIARIQFSSIVLGL